MLRGGCPNSTLTALNRRIFSSRTMCLKFQFTSASTCASVAKAMCVMSAASAAGRIFFASYEATSEAGGLQSVMDSARDGAQGFGFISHASDVRARVLPFSAGNLRYRPLGSIYRGSDLFVALRDPRNLQGKGGHCEFRRICGGSRGRAWATEWNVSPTTPLRHQPRAPLPLPASAISCEA